ncbi:MAG: sigma-70 family RNA polymerase sigma factor [Asticcacaulis sp.]
MAESQNKLHLYLRRRRDLIDYATPILGDRSQAEDVVQEAWLRFSLAGSKAAPDAMHPVSYLYRIVRNMALDVLRRRRREGLVLDDTEYMSAHADQPVGAEQALMARQKLAALEQALDDLPPRTRRAFDMHRFENRTFSDISAELGVSRTRAFELVQEAMAYCIQRLSERGF